MTNFEMVQEFQRKFNCHMDMTQVNDLGTNILKAVAQTVRREASYLKATITTKEGKDNRLLRASLICEEVAELIEAMAGGKKASIAKEAADVHYVTYGTEDAYGFPADKVMSAVHVSNMTKSQDRDASGKIMKGPDYVPPDIEAVLREAA